MGWSEIRNTDNRQRNLNTMQMAERSMRSTVQSASILADRVIAFVPRDQFERSVKLELTNCIPAMQNAIGICVDALAAVRMDYEVPRLERSTGLSGKRLAGASIRVARSAQDLLQPYRTQAAAIGITDRD